MWCGKCQADVAAEVSPDNQRVFCTVCGALLTMIDTPPSRPSTERPASDKTKDARDLLQRWSSGKVLDPFGPPIKKLEPAETPTNTAQPPVAPQPIAAAAERAASMPEATPDVSTKTFNTPTSLSAPASSISTSSQFTTTPLAALLQDSLATAVASRPVDAPKVEATAEKSPSESLPLESTKPVAIMSALASVLPIAPTEQLQTPDTRTPALRTSPSPFVVAAMNSTPVASPLSTSLGMTSLNPVENPLKAAPSIERPATTLPQSPFELPSKAEASTMFPPPVKIRIDPAHDQPGFQGSSAATLMASPAINQATQHDSSGPFAVKPAPPKVEPRRHTAWMPTWDPAFWRTEPSSSGNWTSAAGQLLAYAGVLGLTVGACMVVWSYYGGPATYAPTGWLIATAGQMLLFFGVVTLVSGGLEQTTEQVNKRIEQLGDHIIRIEQAAREMNARGVPPAHFGNDRDAMYASREAVKDLDDERSVVER